jgi:hypothetical protein
VLNCPTEQSELMFQPLLSWCTVAELTQSRVQVATSIVLLLHYLHRQLIPG